MPTFTIIGRRPGDRRRVRATFHAADEAAARAKVARRDIELESIDLVADDAATPATPSLEARPLAASATDEAGVDAAVRDAAARPSPDRGEVDLAVTEPAPVEAVDAGPPRAEARRAETDGPREALADVASDTPTATQPRGDGGADAAPHDVATGATAISDNVLSDSAITGSVADDEDAVAASPPAAVRPARPAARRSPAVMGVVALLVLMGVAGVAMAVWYVFNQVPTPAVAPLPPQVRVADAAVPAATATPTAPRWSPPPGFAEDELVIRVVGVTVGPVELMDTLDQRRTPGDTPLLAVTVAVNNRHGRQGVRLADWHPTFGAAPYLTDADGRRIERADLPVTRRPVGGARAMLLEPGAAYAATLVFPAPAGGGSAAAGLTLHIPAETFSGTGVVTLPLDAHGG